ncbi:MAG: methyltransferase domain-containing protein, partial [Clostridia bacterium]|nr:methyltransferase domain-containing protein [Clostridia bacterium]
MAKWIVEETNPPEKYSDGAAIEAQIFQYVKGRPAGDYSDVLMRDSSWPVNYHLSPVREDILNWYDFSPSDDVLEIGAGMGAVTGTLCRTGGTVTAVELTVNRAKVLFERHSHFENLTVRVGNFNRMEFDHQFDVITLIGVFEYARLFTENGEPANFLNRIRGLLKPGGKLLLAIENRFGLKYWCGALEDHLSKPYVGLRGYDRKKGIETYSRHDLSEILTSCGFVQQQFFYPLPDYKFPLAIYSDRYLPKGRLSDKVKDYYTGRPLLTLNERDLLGDVVENGAFPFMANSFFVECGCGGATLTDLTYASFTPERQPDKRVITRIRNNDTVEKLAVFREGQSHLEGILSIQQRLNSDQIIPYMKKGNMLVMPYLTGETVDHAVVRLFENGKADEAISLIRRFQTQVERLCKPETGESDILSIDLIFQNCMMNETALTEGDTLPDSGSRKEAVGSGRAAALKEDMFRFFDQEWVMNGVTSLFILYRSIHTLYLTNAQLEACYPQQKLFEDTGISS